MPRAVFLIALAVAVSACSRLPWTREAQPNPDEALYYRALTFIDTTGTAQSLDSAVYYLDRYLASSHRQDRAWEAVVLRRLALEAHELRRVQVALDRDAGRSGGRRTETAGGEVVRADDFANPKEPPAP
jgi:hypothetical protein